MTRAVLFSLAVLALLAHPLPGQGANGLVKQIAPDAIVAVSDLATAPERQAATLIAQALRQQGGTANNLRSAEVIAQPAAVDEVGRKHVILVGTVASNPALRHYP